MNVRRLSAVGAIALAFAFASEARAVEFTLETITNQNDPFGQCHNKCEGAGYQIDYDAEGLDTNAQGAIHINNLTIKIDSVGGDYGDLQKVTGNTLQSEPIFAFSTAGATFTIGNDVVTNIIKFELTSVGNAEFKGAQLDPDDQEFVLKIFTTTDTFVFDLCSLPGSQVAFNKDCLITGNNFRFCGTLEGENPPPVPEPTTLFGLGLLVAGAARRRWAKV